MTDDKVINFDKSNDSVKSQSGSGTGSGEKLKSNSSDNDNLSEESDVTSKIQSLIEQLEKQKNEYLYLRAEFENYKRHALKERSDLLKFGGERIVRDLLEVLDNFERALQVEVKPENIGTFHKGIDLTARELKVMLEKHGVTQVDSQGHPFDPAQHEALTIEASTEVAPGHVLRVFKKPYKFYDKTIRTGQVVVAKKPE